MPRGWQEGGIQELRANALLVRGSSLSWVPRPARPGSWAGIRWRRGSGAPVLTLHPVPAHRAEEVGVEAEGLVNIPKDLSDVPDLPRDGHQARLHSLQEASWVPAH